MELSTEPILKFSHLKIDQQNQDKYANAAIDADAGTLLMLSGHNGADNYVLECYQNEEDLKKHENSPQVKHYNEVVNGVATESNNFDLVPELVLTKDDKLKINANDQYFVKLSKFTLVDEDLDKFGSALRNEVEQVTINEEGFVGAVAGKFFDVENEWRVFMIFNDHKSYERHLSGKWHDKFIQETREMIYDSKNEPLTPDSIVDQGEIIYHG